MYIVFSLFQEDNSFSISGLASGSYLLEVHNPDYYYEPVRIDINSKGKVRARKVNNVQPSQVNQLQYPLRLKTQGRYKYFQAREEWKVTDMLMNPMVLMMVLPLLLITVLPKMMNDPETKKEMEQMQQQMNVNNQVTEQFNFNCHLHSVKSRRNYSHKFLSNTVDYFSASKAIDFVKMICQVRVTFSFFHTVTSAVIMEF